MIAIANRPILKSWALPSPMQKTKEHSNPRSLTHDHQCHSTGVLSLRPLARFLFPRISNPSFDPKGRGGRPGNELLSPSGGHLLVQASR